MGDLKVISPLEMNEANVTRINDFPLIYGYQLDIEEDVSFVIEDWLPAESIGLLYSPKDHYKSFLAVDWFMSIASGIPWQGFDVLKGACVYIAGEGNRGLARRCKAWGIRHKVVVESLPIALSLVPMQALDKANIHAWADHLTQVLRDLGEPIRLVVVDTLATNFGPGDENSPTDMARFLAHLKIYIQSAFTCSVLVVHHSGKDKGRGARGGSSIEANADCVFELKRDGNDTMDRVVLHCKHTKDSERPPDILLKPRVVELGYDDRKGYPVTSLILDMELSDIEQKVLTMTKAGKGQRSIAQAVNKSKTAVQKVQVRLRAKNLLPVGKK